MPINTPSHEVAAMEPIWAKVRVALAGEEAVKSKGELFLPRPSGLKKSQQRNNKVDEYRNYKLRALFEDIPARTVKGLAGMLARKEVKLQGGPSGLDSLTKSGKGIHYLASETFEALTSIGRRGFLVDQADADGEAYIATYPAESILDAELDGDRYRSVRLSEVTMEPDAKDQYKKKQVQSVRLLKLGDLFGGGLSLEEKNEAGLGEEATPEDLLAHYELKASDLGAEIYSQEIYQPEAAADDSGNTTVDADRAWVLVRRVIPRKVGGLPLDVIPFSIANDDGCEFSPNMPPVLGIVNLSLAMYRNSADFEHGAHWAGLPTAWASGFALKPGDQMTVGSGYAWVSPEIGAKCGYLEISGTSLKIIAEAMDTKREAMASHGARMLEVPKAAAEAAETVKLRMAGANSFLSGVATAAKVALTESVRWLADWRGLAGSGSIEVAITKDFDTSAMPSDELTANVAAMQGGAISFHAFFARLSKGEVYPEGWTEELERAAIESGPMIGMPEDRE